MIRIIKTEFIHDDKDLQRFIDNELISAEVIEVETIAEQEKVSHFMAIFKDYSIQEIEKALPRK